MLVDIILACAPPVAAVPAVIALLTGHNSFSSTAHLQKRLYRSLLLAEKLAPDVVGGRQISHDIDRQTLQVAYLAQYPRRSREILDVGLIGVGVVAAVVAYYAVLAAGASWLYLLVLLTVSAFAALWFERALVNFSRNDALVRDLFIRFGAPENLVRPRTELVAAAPALTVAVVLERAADVRDADHRGAMTTLDAVNAVLAQAHSHGAWRREVRHLRKTAATQGLSFASRSHDWLLRHLVGPFFTLRLAYLEGRERHRVMTAQRSGDVYKVAWLATHYRNERCRLASHWSHLFRRADTESHDRGDHAPSEPAVPAGQHAWPPR